MSGDFFFNLPFLLTPHSSTTIELIQCHAKFVRIYHVKPVLVHHPGSHTCCLSEHRVPGPLVHQRLPLGGTAFQQTAQQVKRQKTYSTTCSATIRCLLWIHYLTKCYFKDRNVRFGRKPFSAVLVVTQSASINLAVIKRLSQAIWPK